MKIENVENFSRSNAGQNPDKHCILNSGNPNPKEYLLSPSIQIENDISNLSKKELSEKYKSEYSSWKNMKQRRKIGAIIHPSFEDFSSFLKLMGKRPSKSYTLDRVDNKNREYSRKNCRWADKYTQNSNKGNNVYLEHNGEKLTISQWASKTQQKADTLYKRKNMGWSDQEIIYGKSKNDQNPNYKIIKELFPNEEDIQSIINTYISERRKKPDKSYETPPEWALRTLKPIYHEIYEICCNNCNDINITQKFDHKLKTLETAIRRASSIINTLKIKAVKSKSKLPFLNIERST